MYRNATATSAKNSNKKVIFSRNQGKKTYHFYESRGALTAEIQQGETRTQPLVIEGLPPKMELTDPERLQKVQAALAQSHFMQQRESLVVLPRGRGGWGEEQHQGYYEAHQPTCGCFPCGKTQLVAFEPGEGTYRWAMDLGFSSAEAAQIGEQDNAVDLGETNPAPLSIQQMTSDQLGFAQRWHFNINDTVYDAGTEQDSRVQLSVASLNAAIGNVKAKSLGQALNDLGRGLHPLQDIFAHTNGFVTKYAIHKSSLSKETKDLQGTLICYSHLTERGLKADDAHYVDEKTPRSPPSFIKAEADAHLSQRYSDTKTASYLYLLCFLESTGLREKAQFKSAADGIEALLEDRVTVSNVINFDGVMNALLSMEAIKVPTPVQKQMGNQLRKYMEREKKSDQELAALRPGSYLSVALDDQSQKPITWAKFLEGIIRPLEGYMERELKALFDSASRGLRPYRPAIAKRRELLDRFKGFQKALPATRQPEESKLKAEQDQKEAPDSPIEKQANNKRIGPHQSPNRL